MILCCLLPQNNAVAQTPSFFHLTTADGLTDNNIKSIVIDKRGFLWIGTVDGLNMFDGYRVSTYNKKKQRQLASNNIIHLTCDSAGNIWIGTPEGISWLDENRQFHRVVLNDTLRKFPARTIQDTKKYGPVLFTGSGQFWRNEQGRWERLTWIPSSLTYNAFIDAGKFDDNKIIYATDSLVTILDYADQKTCFQTAVKNIISVCRYNDHAIALAFRDGRIQVIDIHTSAITDEYRLGAAVNEIRLAPNGAILVSTSDNGFAVIAAGQVKEYRHDPVEKGSLGSNDVSRVISGPDGDIIIGSRIAGISTYNIYNREAGYTSIFNDGKGHFYDNFISKIAEDDSGILWLGAYEQIIRWDKKRNLSRFYPYPPRAGKSFEIRTLCLDKKGRVWAGTLGDGLSVLNQRTGVYENFSADTSSSPAQRNKTIITLYTAKDGTIWVSTVAGIYTIDPIRAIARDVAAGSGLNEVAGKRVNVFFEDSQGRMWMATNNSGLYCYNPASAELQHFNTTGGLASDQLFGICEDKNKNIYAGCSMGFSIIHAGGGLETYTVGNGLRYDRCDGMLEDSSGHLWISNEKCLVMFDPLSKKMKVFGLNSGLSPEGFRVGSLLKTAAGELIWGSRRGINYFFPEQLAEFSPKLKVSIYRADLQDTSVYVNGNNVVRLRYANNTIVFRFTAVDLQGSSNILYRYMLENYDKSWQEGTDIRETRYSVLPAGNYLFKVMASGDGINWTAAMNSVSVTIVPPVWQRWWFILLVTTGLIILTSILIYNRLEKIKRQREALEIEQAVGKFSSGMSELHHEATLVEYLENYCKQELQFEECRVVEGEHPVRAKMPAISVPLRYEEKIIGHIDCYQPKTTHTGKQHIILGRLAAILAPRIVRIKILAEKAISEEILADTKQKMTEIEMHALRAQMNPHFIFNCLNSINRYIVKSDQVTASLYLTKFAKLIRLILDNSNSKNVLLSNELDALKLYIEMEALRFDKKFTYEIVIDEGVSGDCIEVPPLIIQPYVENAIWHGLLHKQSGGHLRVGLLLVNNNLLQCTIEDDGIGRRKAKELKSKTAVSRKSLGMQLTENRISLLNKHAGQHAMIEIIDMEDSSGAAKGTKVILSIPV